MKELAKPKVWQSKGVVSLESANILKLYIRLMSFQKSDGFIDVRCVA